MMDDWSRPDGVTERWLLVRHGEPEKTARGRCYGKLDVGLSKHGVTQIETLAVLLDHVSIDVIYSSPRKRARQSADILARSRGLECVQCDWLSEIDFGQLEGMTYDEVSRRYPELYERWMTSPTLVQFPGGESFAQMRDRVLSGMRELRSKAANRTPALVAHGGVHRILLAEALGLAPETIFRLAQSYAGLSVLDYYGSEPVVRLLNAVATPSC